MPEKCPHCGKQFANTKALGSHIHYVHETKNSEGVYAQHPRSNEDKERFEHLLDTCLSEGNLPRLREIEKIEQAIAEIPPGVSPTLDKYRGPFQCASGKEKLLKEAEELLPQEETEEAG